MNLYDRSTVCLLDVASIERARPGKIYQAGCILVQVSATQGKTVLMGEAGEVPSKYAVIDPDRSMVSPRYLRLVLDMELPAFLARYQTTINIQMGVFAHLRLDMHNDIATQEAVADVADLMDRRIEGVARGIEMLEDFKAFHLDAMFV